MSWLETHLEEFVRPVVEDQAINSVRYMQFIRDSNTLSYFTPEEMTVIKNIWRSVKRVADGRTILLPGRDVFVWEILARRENYPTIFMPEVSRMTVRYITIPNLDKLFLFDTGFAGSIPKNLGMDRKSFKLMSYSSNWDERLNPLHKTQVFPRLTFSRGLALKVEQTPKYWESARMVGDSGSGTGTDTGTGTGIYTTTPISQMKVHQDLSRLEDFVQAARLTVEVYKNSAPKFIPRKQPIGMERIR